MAWLNAGVSISAALTVCVLIFSASSIKGTVANVARVVLAQQGPPVESGNLPETVPQDESLEAKMARRFPQKVMIGDLIGLPVLDDGNVTLGHVQQVVRCPDGRIKLIVTYSRWFGWFGRPVAVPIEAVGIFGRQIASLDMPPPEYERAPTWTAGTDFPLPAGEIIRIGLARR